jgi:uncharacterized protein involved in exopolysaccharide biosynthesis
VDPQKKGTVSRHQAMEQQQLNILDFLRILRKRKAVFFLVCIPAVIASIAASLFMTKIYKADAVISYAATDKSAGVGSLGGDLFDTLSPFGISPSSNLGEIMKLLESKSMAEEVIEGKGLIEVFFKDERPLLPTLLPFLETKPPTMWDGIRYMADHLDVEYDTKTKTIEISFEFKDPEVAAQVVQEYIDVLNRRIKANTISDAQNVIATLKKELVNTDDIYLREKIYQMLASQIQEITFAESQRHLNFEVIDPPRVPDKKIKPKRRLIVAVSFMGSLFVSLFLILLLEHLERIRAISPPVKEEETSPPTSKTSKTAAIPIL